MLAVWEGLLLIYRRVSERLPWWKQAIRVAVVLRVYNVDIAGFGARVLCGDWNRNRRWVWLLFMDMYHTGITGFRGRVLREGWNGNRRWPHRYHWIQRTCSERGLEWKQEMATQISLDSEDVF
ncbi:MAG: hypothetical protein CMI16_07575 [Opitutaceae bacterium]|nr:hypothetical protein [Opitutaceae bacterium]